MKVVEGGCCTMSLTTLSQLKYNKDSGNGFPLPGLGVINGSNVLLNAHHIWVAAKRLQCLDLQKQMVKL